MSRSGWLERVVSWRMIFGDTECITVLLTFHENDPAVLQERTSHTLLLQLSNSIYSTNLQAVANGRYIGEGSISVDAKCKFLFYTSCCPPC